MYIHNFFLDISQSVSKLFDDYIFGDPNYIKHYEYNLGHAPLQFDKNLKSNYKLPAAIINVDGNIDTIFSDRTDSIRRLINPTNISQIPVLYDKTKDLFLYLHEEFAEIPITVTINCESHLQAQEVSYLIRNYLPVNKYVLPIKFKSLLEIPEKFLNNNYFDVVNDEIINLYQRINYTYEYPETTTLYFAVTYEPAVKLNSVNVDISDSMQRTFQVIANISYCIQIPVFIYSDKTGVIERININYTFTKNEQIYVPTIFQQVYDEESPVSDITYIRNLIIREEDLEYITQVDDYNDTIDLFIYFDKIYPAIELDQNYKYKFITAAFADYVDPVEINQDENYVRFNFQQDEFDSTISPVNNQFLLISIQFVQ